MTDVDAKSKATCYCSFCGKSQHQVKKLIAGPTVYICDECVDLCNLIVEEENFTPGARPMLASDIGLPEPDVPETLQRAREWYADTQRNLPNAEQRMWAIRHGQQDKNRILDGYRQGLLATRTPPLDF